METDRLLVGIKQSLKTVENNAAEKVFVALDADLSVTDKIIKKCKAKNIPLEYVTSMEKLGQMCRISVGASVAVVEKRI